MPVDIVIPQAGESVTQGVIASWRKKDGDFVKRDEEVLDLETDKVTLAVTAPASGVLTRKAKEGDTVPVGAVVGLIEEGAKEPTPNGARAKAEARVEAKAEGPKIDLPKAEPPPSDGVRATPLARKVAEELGVDITKVAGTGAGGRVREQDVVAFAGKPGTTAAPAAPAAPQVRPGTPPAPPVAPPQPSGPRGATRERLSPLRQRVAARLVQSQHTAAMLTTFNECDMTAVMDLRKRYKEDFEKRHGVGLGFMSFFVKAAVNALHAFPLVNAYLVEEAGQLLIEKHDFCDIAIAVASPKGLVVPVLRDCQALSMSQVEARIKDFGARAKEGKLTLEEMQGGTFTITNGGIFGSLNSTPILNPPQSAILGMHAIKNRPVEDPANPGHVAIRPMMYLALSYDHRIIDGREAVLFLVAIKEALEDPARLVLEI